VIKAGDTTIHSEIHKFINSTWNKEELPEEWMELIIIPIYKKSDKKTVVIVEAYHFCQLHTTYYPTYCC
jgi:hypothetical protein